MAYVRSNPPLVVLVKILYWNLLMDKGGGTKDNSSNNTSSPTDTEAHDTTSSRKSNNSDDPGHCNLVAFALVFEQQRLSYKALRTCALVSKGMHKTAKDVFTARYKLNWHSYPPSIIDGEYDAELCKILYVPAKANGNDNSSSTSGAAHDGYIRMWWKGYATSKQYRRMHVDVLNAAKIYGVSSILIDAYESKIIGSDDQTWIAQEWFGSLKALPFSETRLAVLNSKFLFSRAGIENIYNKTRHYWTRDNLRLRHFDSFAEAEEIGRAHV